MRVFCVHAWLAALAVATFTGHAGAGVSARLVYMRSRHLLQCPDQPALERAVAARLGYNPFFAWAEKTIVAQVTENGDALRARAELVDKDGVVQGSRELTGKRSDCGDLVASLALAISITLDPMSVTRDPKLDVVEVEQPRAEDPPLKVVAPDPRPVADAPPTDDVGKKATDPLPSNVHGSMFLGPFASFGSLPGASPGLGAGIRIGGPLLSIGVEGAALLPTTETVDGAGTMRASLVLARIFPCAELAFFGFCALGSVGRMQGTGEGVNSPRQEALVHGAAGARVLGTFPIGPGWALVAHVDAQANLTRPLFQLNGQDVWRPAAVSAEAGVALSTLFF